MYCKIQPVQIMGPGMQFPGSLEDDSSPPHDSVLLFPFVASVFLGVVAYHIVLVLRASVTAALPRGTLQRNSASKTINPMRQRECEENQLA